LKEFIEVNKKKLLSCVKWSSIIFTSLVIIAFSAAIILKGQRPDLILVMTVILFASVFFPLFITAISAAKDCLAYIKAKSIFESYPINELQKLGINKAFENSKWTYTQLVLKGQFENYKIECNVKDALLKITVQVNLDLVTKEHIENLKSMFGKKNIELDWLGIALVYNSKRRKDLTLPDLETEIRQLIMFLKTEKLTPWE
jgi:hypothetical protein